VTPANPPTDLARALRRVQRSVLVTLAVCALVSATVAVDGDGVGAADPRFTGVGVALGLVSIVARRSALAPRTRPRARVRLCLLSLLAAGAVGLTGVALALTRGEREAGILYALAGAILALRPPRILAPDASPAQGSGP
jgi:hypothetical protein